MTTEPTPEVKDSVGFLELLTLLLIGLQATDQIDVSTWLILGPLLLAYAPTFIAGVLIAGDWWATRKGR